MRARFVATLRSRARSYATRWSAFGNVSGVSLALSSLLLLIFLRVPTSFTSLRFSASDLIRLVLVTGSWLGAATGTGLLLYARNQMGWGWRATREIGSILIDTGLLFMVAIVVLGVLAALRIFGIYGSDDAVRIAGLISTGAIFLLCWIAVGRLLVFLLWGDGTSSPRTKRNPRWLRDRDVQS